jgi:hypothetical protein
MTVRALLLGVALAASAASGAYVASPETPNAASLRFEITLGEGRRPSAPAGRLLLVLGRGRAREPRLDIGETGMDAAPLFGRDVARLEPGVTVTIDDTAAAFPLRSLAALEPGTYSAQAVFDSSTDLKSPNAPGNLYSEVRAVRLDPAQGGTIRLELTRAVPPEQAPPDTEWIRHIELRSTRLSDFHGRPIHLRAAVLLPRGYDREPDRRYPLRVRSGGYGSRYTAVERLMRSGSEFRAAWLSDEAPRMLLLHLDGAGPFGDPYQVNSDNNGPYGDAVTAELIPHVERTFRGIGRPTARVVDGGSTGGWVSLALQIFYPDFFNGAWSYCPDGVDFRGFQLVDIYTDANAFVNARGFERPSARELNGDVRFTMRHELQLENVLGTGDSWTTSGQQWGAWNATYGPRGADGRPKPLWDPATGAIDRSVAAHWQTYDLRLVLERNWAALAPKLDGKIRIWVGEADNYFLNNAVHMLDDFLGQAKPSIRARIEYGPGKGHCWKGPSELAIMKEMGAVTTATGAAAAAAR